jgi:hypothetical protein
MAYTLRITKAVSTKPEKLHSPPQPPKGRVFQMATRIVRYASLEVNGDEVYGTAELVNHSGYLFRKDGERKALLISYKDPNLMLYGLVALVEQADIADGNRVLRCSKTLQGVA